MRWLLIALSLLLLFFQYQLWLGEGGLANKLTLEREVTEQQVENEALRQRNQILVSEVVDLKEGVESIEERARTDLGMIKEGETFYMVVEPEDQ
ncbi:MAG: cell division protein FtsB [Gammaproteobacteria bacterium]|nr:MAG: cell division protein FtsB [Gammaproteobacteria bacterium]